MSNPAIEVGGPVRTYALVIGLSRYKHERITTLEYTHADVLAFSSLLSDPMLMGVPRDNIRVLEDEQATLSEVKKAMSGWLHQQAREDSTVLIFFAGHGGCERDPTTEDEDGILEYLLLWDSDPEDLFATALPHIDFDRFLKAVRARRLVVFLDACHSGGVAQRGARDMQAVIDAHRWQPSGEGRVVIAAARANQKSYEDASWGHGAFTYFLLEALKGKADTNQDGYVSILEVYEYLRASVPANVRKLKHASQEPIMVGALAGTIVLSVDARKVEEARARGATEAKHKMAELQAKKEKLLRLFALEEDSVARCGEAWSLLCKPGDQLTNAEQFLRLGLDQLLDDKLSLAQYMKMARSSGQPPASPPTSGVREASSFGQAQNPVNRRGERYISAPSHSPPHKPRPKVFCSRCGARLSGDFCLRCGR
jgi:uncharacterized caspase-like protein